MSDGNTVEDAITANKTSILDLQENVIGQVARAKKILNDLSNKVE